MLKLLLPPFITVFYINYRFGIAEGAAELTPNVRSHVTQIRNYRERLVFAMIDVSQWLNR